MIIPDDDYTILSRSVLNALGELEALKFLHDKNMGEADKYFRAQYLKTYSKFD